LKLVLGSSSPYRKKLLEKLPVQFECFSPDIDETPHVDETPEALVERLSIEKAKAVAKHYDNSLIISSDQIAIFQGQILGKPHQHDKAVEMLSAFSGHTVRFETGLCLYNTQTRQHQYTSVPTLVHFRQLSKTTIENYLRHDQPYKCAGSFQAEGLGVVLFDSLESRDPNALIGLPLIALNMMLLNEGFDVLSDARGHD
jgi:MAF protein